MLFQKNQFSGTLENIKNLIACHKAILIPEYT